MRPGYATFMRPGYGGGMGGPQAGQHVATLCEHCEQYIGQSVHDWGRASMTQGMPGGPPTQTYMQDKKFSLLCFVLLGRSRFCFETCSPGRGQACHQGLAWDLEHAWVDPPWVDPAWDLVQGCHLGPRSQEWGCRCSGADVLS